MSDKQKLKELVSKGKSKNLNNNELLELIHLLGPEQALNAMRKSS